jgi:hypothetical protein
MTFEQLQENPTKFADAQTAYLANMNELRGGIFEASGGSDNIMSYDSFVLALKGGSTFNDDAINTVGKTIAAIINETFPEDAE